MSRSKPPSAHYKICDPALAVEVGPAFATGLRQRLAAAAVAAVVTGRGRKLREVV